MLAAFYPPVHPLTSPPNAACAPGNSVLPSPQAWGHRGSAPSVVPVHLPLLKFPTLLILGEAGDGMTLGHTGQTSSSRSLTLDDVAMDFRYKERKPLDSPQEALYIDLMPKNFGIVITLSKDFPLTHNWSNWKA